MIAVSHCVQDWSTRSMKPPTMGPMGTGAAADEEPWGFAPMAVGFVATVVVTTTWRGTGMG